MKYLKYFSLLPVFFGLQVSAQESWSPALKVKLLFPQAVRENVQHPHSGKTLVALSDMTWLPSACTNKNYFFIESTDNHLYSLLLSSYTSGSTIQAAVSDQRVAGGVCRATMLASPAWE